MGTKRKQEMIVCPFKKIYEREHNSTTGKTTVHERFAPCAGRRCMAYEKGRFEDTGRCKRLEG